jgi:predicted amidohydrolase YtcJ
MVSRGRVAAGNVAAGNTVLVVNAEIGGRPGLGVRVSPEEILEVGAGLAPRRGETVLDAAGGAVIPGLHDHHVHLRGLLAARLSADVSAAADPAAFDRMVTAAAAAAGPGGWLRATGWSETSAGPLDRRRMDALTGAVPARVQHRSGAMWVLNSAALRQVGADDSDADGIERDDRGVPTGRLLRLDGWLRDRLPSALPAGWLRAGLAGYGRQCARLGLTGFTDATPDRDQADVDAFGRLSADGTFPQRLHLMAPPGLRPPPAGRVTLGPRKMVLDDTALPEVTELAALAEQTHRRGCALAVHCVTAEQLIVAVAAFEHAGAAGDRIEHAGAAGDRIEHASVVPPGYAARLARLGLSVITQPGFISARGDDYLREVPGPEHAWLYPCATLARAGTVVAAGTDAPFGPPDPWRCVAAAVTRRTPSGRVLGRAERLSPARALRLFLTAPEHPGRLREVRPGQPGDLCVLRTPLRPFLSRPAADGVRAGIAAAQVFEADPPG